MEQSRGMTDNGYKKLQKNYARLGASTADGSSTRALSVD